MNKKWADGNEVFLRGFKRPYSLEVLGLPLEQSNRSPGSRENKMVCVHFSCSGKYWWSSTVKIYLANCIVCLKLQPSMFPDTHTQNHLSKCSRVISVRKNTESGFMHLIVKPSILYLKKLVFVTKSSKGQWTFRLSSHMD